MRYEIRNMAGEVVAHLPDTPGQAVASVLSETDALHAVLTAAEHLADVAERRSPTEALTEALERYREAVLHLKHPLRDIRPGSDGFRGSV